MTLVAVLYMSLNIMYLKNYTNISSLLITLYIFIIIPIQTFIENKIIVIDLIVLKVVGPNTLLNEN